MRAVPAFQVTVSHLGWWRLLHVAVAVLTVAAMSAWFLSRAEYQGVAGTVTAMAAWLVWTARQQGRLAAFTLRWDTQRWHLGPAGSGSPGQLSVAVDVGPWMLLKFTPESIATRWPAVPVWLALQRSGLELQWHALRCTLYGARASYDATLRGPAP